MMKLLLMLGLLTILTGCTLVPSHLTSSADDHAHTPDQLADPNHHDMDHGTMTMDHSQHGGDHSHTDMVTSVFDFIYLMIPHHQEAVDTSRQLLQTTQNPELIALASGIVMSQTTEIQQMNEWLMGRYSGVVYQGMGYQPMMRSLSGLTTEQIDQQWTEDMIKHHQGAVDMANKVLELLETNTTELSQDQKNIIDSFARTIIATQESEIQQMQTILDTYQ